MSSWRIFVNIIYEYSRHIHRARWLNLQFMQGYIFARYHCLVCRIHRELHTTTTKWGARKLLYFSTGFHICSHKIHAFTYKYKGWQEDFEGVPFLHQRWSITFYGVCAWLFSIIFPVIFVTFSLVHKFIFNF